MTIEWHPRKREYRGSVRLGLGDRVLPPRRNRSSTPEGLIDAAFDDLEEQLATKPARWSMPGWLAWLARWEIRRETRGMAVAQSTEARA